jgi:hypothetical protein
MPGTPVTFQPTWAVARASASAISAMFFDSIGAGVCNADERLHEKHETPQQHVQHVSPQEAR